jgi:hypothetical protein
MYKSHKTDINYIRIVTDLPKALLGNSSVNTFQNARHKTIRWKCFLCVSTRTVAMQCSRGDVTQQWEPQQTHDNYTTLSEGCFLCVVRAEGL